MQSLPVIAERYECLELLGEGSFARTLRARDRDEGRIVAVKVLHPSRMSSARDFDRFEREAGALARLRHVAIPRYVDHFPTRLDGEPVYCIVQEFKAGRDLQTLLQSGERWDAEQVTDIARQVLEVLDYLAEQDPPVVHRDIKPANLILDAEGHVHLVDFGAVREAVRQTIQAGSTVIGTFGYMPPEQLMGRATHASDLFALGVTLIALLARRPAHELSGDGFTIPVHELSLGIPDRLRDVLRALVAPRLEDRYQDASQVRADLDRVSRGERPVHVGRLDLAIARRRRREERERARALRRGSQLLYWLVVGVVLLAVVGAFVFGLRAVVTEDALATGDTVTILTLLTVFSVVGSLTGLGARYIAGAYEPPPASWLETVATVVGHRTWTTDGTPYLAARLVWEDDRGATTQAELNITGSPSLAPLQQVGVRTVISVEPGRPENMLVELSQRFDDLPPRRAAADRGNHG
ncbi:MAG: serine/threonine protein kinase [Deltaproteobacteria bacterium]|nr:MAG: serine/threonine protein kinase [Deltaproteobacteria bacterium]